MSLLNDIRIIVCGLYGDDVSSFAPIEKWCLKNSKLCSADEIIAAAAMESFAKSYEDWHLKMWDDDDYYNSSNHTEVLPSGCSRYDVDSRLVNEKKNFKIYWKYVNLAGKKTNLNMFVNNVSVTNEAARAIQSAFFRVKNKQDAIEAAARKAKREMERNEAAWNLAESLLGMKRNEFGALVPISEIEDCDCDLGELCECCK